MTSSGDGFLRGEVLQRSLPQGGRQVLIAIHYQAKDGSPGEVSHYELHYKAHAGSETEYFRLTPQAVQQVFERFNIKPQRQALHWPTGSGKAVRDTLRYAEHQPHMDYRARPKSASARLQGHVRDAFYLAKGLTPPREMGARS